MRKTPPEQPFASTTFEWRRVKIARPPEARTARPPKAGLSYYRRLSPWPWRKRPLHIAVTYRGGAECWFEIHARGGTIRRPGVIALVDLVKEIANVEL